MSISKLFTSEQLEQANKNGLSYQVLYTRVFNYEWDVEKAVTVPVKQKFGNGYPKFTTEQIETAKQNGVSYTSLCNRIRRGWSIEKAIKEPSKGNWRVAQ